MSNASLIGLAEAAQRLMMPYQDCHRLLLTGVIRGEKRKGRWFVLERDVDELGRARGLGTSETEEGDDV